PQENENVVMALLPTPGNVDLVVASELLEAGRAAQTGMITPERTTVIASTHRLYAIAEKSAMGDGRFDTDRILATVKALAKRPILGDIGAVATDSGALISAVMFGAMAGTGVLPIARAQLEGAIERGGIAVQANLRGFEAGFAFAQANGSEQVVPDVVPDVVADLCDEAFDDRVEALPTALHEVVRLGLERTDDYQGTQYASKYLARVERQLAVERGQAHGVSSYTVTSEVCRYLALWMSYEDVIRVADLKTRAERLARVRSEVQAAPGQPVTITEFLKPGVEEWTAILPRFVAAPLTALVKRLGWTEFFSVGLHVKSTTISGFLLLWSLGRLRWWRPFTARYADEQARIERWLTAVGKALEHDYDLAIEIAKCANLVKGYGDTHARGRQNFDKIIDNLDALKASPESAVRARRLREAALADPEGAALAAAFAELTP
ncbi:MAG: indolepyruvate ferredoxin oxidoreductase beta subunit, partial [Gammaproteobacteria bacterium]